MAKKMNLPGFLLKSFSLIAYYPDRFCFLLIGGFIRRCPTIDLMADQVS